MRDRAIPAAMALATILAGVAARSGTLPGFWAKYLGVALWCALVYWLVVLARPRISIAWACIASAAIGCAVELFQLTPWPRQLASTFPPSRWVLGTTFSHADLPAYILGAIGAAALHLALRHMASRQSRASAQPTPQGIENDT